MRVRGSILYVCMQNRRNYLDVISKHLEIHATVSDIEVRGCIKRGCTSIT